jgi:hypothetical protein
MVDKTWLQEQIIGFMVVVLDCLSSTTYANDRAAYQHDITLIAEWLAELHKGAPASDVAGSIIDRQTDKSFGDYWKQGEWGNNELKALKSLQATLEDKIGKS